MHFCALLTQTGGVIYYARARDPSRMEVRGDPDSAVVGWTHGYAWYRAVQVVQHTLVGSLLCMRSRPRLLRPSRWDVDSRLFAPDDLASPKRIKLSNRLTQP